MPSNIIGYLHGHNSSACLVQDGRVVAFIEEERLIRQKHAVGIFPVRAIEGCLKQGGITLADVDCFAFGYDAPRFDNGEIAAFYDKTNETYPPDPGTKGWQQLNLRRAFLKGAVRSSPLGAAALFRCGQRHPARIFPAPRIACACDVPLFRLRRIADPDRRRIGRPPVHHDLEGLGHRDRAALRNQHPAFARLVLFGDHRIPRFRGL